MATYSTQFSSAFSQAFHEQDGCFSAHAFDSDGFWVSYQYPDTYQSQFSKAFWIAFNVDNRGAFDPLGFYSGGFYTTSSSATPQAYFDPVAYDGQTLTTSIYTTKTISPSMYSSAGGIVLNTINVPAAITFNPLMYGSIGGITGVVSTSATFSPNLYDGSTNTTVLSTYPSVNIGTVPIYSGETFNCAISTSTSFSPNLYDGQTLDVTVTTYTSAYISGDFYDGQTNTFSLSTSALVFANSYDGQTSNVILATYPSASITGNAYDGSSTSLELATSRQLGLFPSYSGETLFLGSVTNEPNWYFYDGSQTSVALATTPTFNFGLYDGQTSVLQLDTHPAEPIQIRFYDGSEFSVTNLKTLVHAEFSVEFKSTSWVQLDWNSTTTFDLTLASCCEFHFDDPYIIDLDFAPQYNYRWAGNDFVKTSVTLTSNQRFVFNFYDGSTFYTKDLVQFDPHFYDGSHASVSGMFIGNLQCQPLKTVSSLLSYAHDGSNLNVSLKTDEAIKPRFFDGSSVYADINSFDFGSLKFYDGTTTKNIELETRRLHLLCKDSLRLTGYNLIIDLAIDDYKNCCNILFSDTGSYATCSLSASPNVSGFAYDGSRATLPTIEVPVPWRFNFWHGSAMTFKLSTNDTFKFNAYSGEVNTIKFYEYPILGYSGEIMQATLTPFTKVDNVVFGENGCLDNEWQAVDEDGFPIGPINPVPIELDNYLHWIKARCY